MKTMSPPAPRLSVALVVGLAGSIACPGPGVDDVAPQDRDACEDNRGACAILSDAMTDEANAEANVDAGDEEAGDEEAGDEEAGDLVDAGNESAAREVDAPDTSDATDDARDAGDASDGFSPCENGTKDGDETDVDCGGSCPACDVNHACSTDADCMTSKCASSLCTLASGPPNWIKAGDMPQLFGTVAAAVFTYGNPRGTLVATKTSYDASDANFATFDFATNAWTTAPMPTGPAYHGMTTDLLGRVYLVGGSLASPWRYDGAAWTTTLAAQHFPRNFMGVATGSDGRIYAIGGEAAAKAINTVEVYDTAADSWTTLAKPMPSSRSALGAVALGHRVYAIGGYVRTNFSNSLPTVEAYDLDAQSWSTRSSLPQPLDTFASAAGPDGRIYVAGGFSTRAGFNTPVASVYAYDPSSDRWTSLPALAKARSGVAAAVGPDGRIYVLGDGITMLGTVEVYGPVVSITPSHAPPGAPLLVTGSNFAANAKVRVYLGSALVKTGQSTPTGGLLPSITATVPNVASGDTVITVVDDKSRYPITSAFTVDAP